VGVRCAFGEAILVTSLQRKSELRSRARMACCGTGLRFRYSSGAPFVAMMQAADLWDRYDLKVNPAESPAACGEEF
jgi:hypothetical protein